jgi:plastocyanin
LRFVFNASLLLVLFPASCEGRKEPAHPGDKPAGPAGPEGKDVATPAAASKAASILKGASGYEVAEVANPGSLRVNVVFAGDPIPDVTEVPVNIDVPVCGHKVFTENLLVDKETRGLKNVVVRLEGIARGKAPPPVVTVTNRNCAFDPHVSTAVKGTKIDIRNADPVLHTTHPYLAGSSFFNLALPVGADPPQARPIPRTGLMEITCDVHKWMRGYMVVHTNPYIEVTDKLGKLAIEGIPPGKYPYVAWHEQLGEKKGEIEIVAGQAAELKLELAAPK